MKRIAIIGAGPIGLEAALHGVTLGFDVHVFERGTVAHNVREWGHVRLFSPFEMNSTPESRAVSARSVLSHSRPTRHGSLDSQDDAYLTGREFAACHLVPLSQSPELAGRIHEHTAVIAVGRSRYAKGDAVGKPSRLDDSFQLLLRKPDGLESLHAADFVLDCSGTYPHHNWLGAGGIPCPGEIAAASQIDYLLPDVLGKDRARFIGKRVLVIGSGFSAATAVANLVRLALEHPATRIFWITRGDKTPPLSRIPDDPLPERDQIAATANRLAMESEGQVHFLPGQLVRGIQHGATAGTFIVSLQGSSDNTQIETLPVERVIANVGYRPDRFLYEELQVHECYASQGPMKLAAALAGESSFDCLTQKVHGSETLRNPEPGFFILGAKSYGRDSRFLIRIGLQQIEDVFKIISEMRT